MRRIKVISEPTDLVPLLRSLETPTKRAVFREVATQWCPSSYLRARYGEEGVEAARFFEKMKLVESRFESVGGSPEKVYHSYYSSFHINASMPVTEVGEILAVASMPEDEFRSVEEEVVAMAGEAGVSARAVTEKLDIPLVRLRALLKRSTRLDLRGHVVVPAEEDKRKAAAPSV